MLRDTRFQRINVFPITGALGADIRGVDLSNAPDTATMAEVRKALDIYHVIAVREQTLTPASYKAVAARFGAFSPNPVHASMPGLEHIIRFEREPDDTGKVIGEDWHMDLAWLPRPPGITMLYGEVVPAVGGDTCFSSLAMAYRALSPRLRALLLGQTAVHSGKGVFAINAMQSRLALRADAASAEETEVVHPLVCMHPVTKEPYLFVSSVMRSLMGLSEDESRPLIQYLLQVATRPEFQCRVRWEAGTLTMWDNPCVLHTAINDYPGYRRVTYRTTIEGWVPVAASADASTHTGTPAQPQSLQHA
ncbi:MAG: TauD/TfdA family dioxygenase [Rhodoferax sp.]|jgi:taurine dioxygenase|nr:TauD/TfdA family dioxygenase [Rhodoferax sp.]